MLFILVEFTVVSYLTGWDDAQNGTFFPMLTDLHNRTFKGYQLESCGESSCGVKPLGQFWVRDIAPPVHYTIGEDEYVVPVNFPYWKNALEDHQLGFAPTLHGEFVVAFVSFKLQIAG